MAKTVPNNDVPTVDEPIQIVGFDPQWREIAAREVASLQRDLAGFEVEIEHIGSTAVDGMTAKPIIDLMVGLRWPGDLERVVKVVSSGGWLDLGEAGVPGRRYLRRREFRDLNLHLVSLQSAHWRGALAMRDFLRAHPEERSAYIEAKANAVVAGQTSLLAYSDAKASHVADLVQRALAWVADPARGG